MAGPWEKYQSSTPETPAGREDRPGEQRSGGAASLGRLNIAPGEIVEPVSGQVRPAVRLVTTAEQVAASFDLDNFVTAVSNRLAEPSPPDADPLFDAREHLKPGEELIAAEFNDARSLGEMNLIRQRIERENNARELLATGPLNEFLATSIAVAADPTSYIPLVGLVGKGRTASRLAKLGLAGAAEAAISEAALQSVQETRTLSESLTAVLLGAGFTAGIGAAGAALGRGADRAIEDFMTIAAREFPEEAAPVGGPKLPDQIGAQGELFPEPEGAPAVGAQVARPEAGDTRLVGSFGLAETLARLGRVGLAAPSLELAASKLSRSREAVHRLVDTGLVTEGMVKGLAFDAPVETRIRRYNTVIRDTARTVDRAYKEYRGAGGTMTRDRYYQEIGRALRRREQSKVPGISDVADRIRNDVFEPLKKEAIALKLLPEDVNVKTAASYFTRVYDRAKIRAKRPEFKARIEAWLRRSLNSDEIVADAEYGEIADQIIDAVLGHPSDRVPFIRIPKQRGPTKERTFLIPDYEIEDFLESNVLEVASRYVRTMSADIEFSRAFGRPDPGENMAKEIREEAAKLADAAPTERERTSILKQAEREAILVQALTEKIRGTTSRPIDPAYRGLVRVGTTLRTLNFLRLLGSVMLSSVPDLGRIVMEEGLTRTVGTVLTDFGRAFKGIRLATKEAQIAGTALDIDLGTRNRMLLDLGERYSDESRFEHWVDTAGQVFGNITLLNHWNTALKSIASSVISTRILESAEKLAQGKALSKREIRKLAQANISQDMAVRIGKQAKHWERIGQVRIGNTVDWTDAGAVEAFRNALLRDVDNTILTPGRGDAPIWTSSEFGKTIFQFKRFAAASTQRILISGLQNRDAAAMNGILLMIGLGAAATAMRDIVSDGEVRDRDGREWALDAIDRSGALSLFIELDAVADKFSGGNLSLQRAITGQEASRFASRDVLGQLLGPTAGAVEDIASATQGALQDDFTQSDLHKLRRLLPGQNVFYTRWLFDQMEEAIGDSFGLPERQPRRGDRKAVLPGAE